MPFDYCNFCSFFVGTFTFRQLGDIRKYYEQIWMAVTKWSSQTCQTLDRRLLKWYWINLATACSFLTNPIMSCDILIWVIWRSTPCFLETFIIQQVWQCWTTLFTGPLKVMEIFQEPYSKQKQLTEVQRTWSPMVSGIHMGYTHTTPGQYQQVSQYNDYLDLKVTTIIFQSLHCDILTFILYPFRNFADCYLGRYLVVPFECLT